MNARTRVSMQDFGRFVNQRARFAESETPPDGRRFAIELDAAGALTRC